MSSSGKGLHDDNASHGTLYHGVTWPQRVWHTRGQLLCKLDLSTQLYWSEYWQPTAGLLEHTFVRYDKQQQTPSLIVYIYHHTSATYSTCLRLLPRNEILNSKGSMSAFFILEVPHSMRKSYFREPLTNTTLYLQSQIAKFMVPTWGPPGSCRPKMGPMLASWTLLSGVFPNGLTVNDNDESLP